MRNSNKILGIGIALVIIPILGLPVAWKNFIFIILGLWLCYMAFFVKKERSGGKVRAYKKEHFDGASSFVENQPAKIKSDYSETVSVPNNHEQNPQV